MWFIRSLLVAAVLVTIGCGGPTTESVEPPTAMEKVKSQLQSMVDSGKAGSGLMQLDAAAKGLDDPDKASAVEKGSAELMKLSDPEEIKAKAKEILDSL